MDTNFIYQHAFSYALHESNDEDTAKAYADHYLTLCSDDYTPSHSNIFFAWLQEKELHPLAKLAVLKARVYGKKEINNVFYMAETKDRDDFERYLVEKMHYLAYEAGSPEYRFRTFIKSML